MLAVSPLRCSNDERQGEMESCPDGVGDFSDVFPGGNLLDGIDFDDLFVGIEDGDVLPDLEMDPELLAEFSVSGCSGGEESAEKNASASVGKVEGNDSGRREDEEEGKSWASGLVSSSCQTEENQEILSKREEAVAVNPPPKVADKGRKSSTQPKASQGKRKVKVDWTPDLHRRFVQAVEQLGVDKAVPSRILEVMGIDCLTRHNIASHLQKYRSHRKHLLAREAEAASWSQRRQMHGGAGGGSKRDHMNPWLKHVPTMGFPPPTPLQPFRPLHVWGHPSPTVDHSVMHMWPKHLVPSPPPPWAPPPPDPYWHPHHQRVPTALAPGTPCFQQPLATTRFPTPPVRGIPPHPHAMYKLDKGSGFPTAQSDYSHHPLDLHPSKESIDAAIGDILSKPWQPLPIGLKPPSLDSVLVELQLQGISKIPPNCA
ncbi:PREDICTED: probable transcription factor GLK1 isoform X2 [Nelumbo nucifera]|nr:PREDICTED: probable transcription factor GLK1 isoform X2 [Nelumbo nucifera]